MRNLTPEMGLSVSAVNMTPALMAELYFDSGTVYIWSGVGTLRWGEKQYIGGGNLIAISEVKENQGLEATGLIATLNGIPSNLIGTVLSENQRGRPFKLYLGAVTETGDVLTEDGDNVLLEWASNLVTEDDEDIITEAGDSLYAEGALPIFLGFDEFITEDGDTLITEDGDTLINEGNYRGEGVVLTEARLIDAPYRIFNGLMDTMEITDSGETSTVNLTVESIMLIGQSPKLRRYTQADQQKHYPLDTGLKFMNSLQDKEVVW